METVSVQIPAALFTAIYAQFKEQTGNVINDSLSRLIDPNLSNSPSHITGTPQYPRPGSGTITGKVWDIADQLFTATGEADRIAVVTACVEQMININTANTQYSHWKAATIRSKE